MTADSVIGGLVGAAFGAFLQYLICQGRIRHLERENAIIFRDFIRAIQVRRDVGSIRDQKGDK